MKKRVKFLALILSLAMLLSLAACGNGPAPSDADKPADNAGVAGEANKPENAEPMVLKIATNYGENHTVTLGIKEFIKYIEEHTDGAITFELYTGGTFCAITEEPEYVSSGATDVGFVMPAYMFEHVPMLSYATQSCRGYEDAIAMANKFLIDTPEYAEVIEKQCTAYNIKFIDFFPFSCTAPVGSIELTSWDDMVGHTFGIAVWADVFKMLGIDTISFPVTDTYENLNKGVCEIVSAGLKSTVDMGLYEIAKNCLITDIVNCAPDCIVNLETWNKLTPEQQQIFYEAMDVAQQFELETYLAEGENTAEFLEENGVTVTYMSAEDELKFIEAYYTVQYNIVKNFATPLGDAEILKAMAADVNEYLGINVQYE